MDTSKFKTKTEFIERKNPSVSNVWEIALDIGYSAVKLFGPNIVARFPSYAKRVENDFKMLTASPDSCILFQDMENNEMWVVGEFAQNLIKRGDTADSEETLYGREREGNPIYQVITKVGLGIACMGGPNGEVGDKPVLVQTGLPEKYLKSGKDGIIETIAGHHDFRIKIGERPWAHFIFDIREDNKFVRSQPMGTLFSACMESNGSFRADGNKLLSSSCIVFDPGFGTLDIFPIIKGVVKHGETFEDLGMKRVLQETSDMIFEKYHVEIPVAAMQKYLATGTIIVSKLDRKKAELSSKEEPFGDILAEANSKICEEAIARTLNAIDIFEYNNFILTGGTGAAWRDMILNKFKNLSTLRIIDGNANDNLAFVYSNVRGYYLSRYARLLKDNR